MRRVETMCISKLLKTNKYMNKNRSEISQIKFKNTIQLKPKKKQKTTSIHIRSTRILICVTREVRSSDNAV